MLKLKDVVNALEMQGEEMKSYLNRQTGKIVTISNDDMRAAENAQTHSDPLSKATVPSSVQPKIAAIDHVQLAMPAGEEDKARSFYADILGLQEVPKPPNLAKRGGLWLELGNVKVHLGIEQDFRPAQKAHPAFLVEELAALIERCQQSGYQVIPDEQIPGVERVYVYDPFGNRIELISVG